MKRKKGSKTLGGRGRGRLEGAAGAGIAGGAGYGITKYANTPGGKLMRGNVVNIGRAARAASATNGFARTKFGKIAKAGDNVRGLAKSKKGLALFGAAALGAAYYAKSKRSRKTQIK